MEKKYPAVCYIIPVYNDIPGLRRTLNSVAADIDLVSAVFICDDGGKVDVEKELRSDNWDLPITVLRQPKNMGLSAALNRLIQYAIDHGFDFAAIIDAGDLTRRGRISLQLDGFAKYHDAIVLGGNMDVISLEGQFYCRYNPPSDYLSVRKAFRKGYPFAHPTAMFNLRKMAKISERYSVSVPAAVDYEYFYRLHSMDPKSVISIPDVIVDYIRDPHSMGVKKAGLQARQAWKVRLRHVSLYDLDSILGLLDIRLILRALSPALFFKTSAVYQLLKGLILKKA